MEDTRLGRWLPAFTRRPKRRVIGAPKFYFFDVGVVNQLAWMFHEIVAANTYRETFVPISVWRLASGALPWTIRVSPDPRDL